MRDFDNFDRNLDRAWKFSGIVIAASVLLSLALTGVIIWAIIAVVLHFT